MASLGSSAAGLTRVELHRLVQLDLGQVHPEDLLPPLDVRTVNGDLAVKATCGRESGSGRGVVVGGLGELSTGLLWRCGGAIFVLCWADGKASQAHTAAEWQAGQGAAQPQHTGRRTFVAKPASHPPGRMSALSRMSGRLVPASTTTLAVVGKPSISTCRLRR